MKEDKVIFHKLMFNFPQYSVTNTNLVFITRYNCIMIGLIGMHNYACER